MSAKLEKLFMEMETLLKESLREVNTEDKEDTITPKIQSIHKRYMEESSRRKTGEEAAEMMENFVNCMSMKAQEEEFAKKIVFGTHRTLNQSFWGLIFKTINMQATEFDKGRFDLRNEASGKLCKKIVETLGDDLMFLPFI